jgi:hypothetical protein
MLVRLTGQEIHDRVDLLKTCYATFTEVCDLKTEYEIVSKKTSILNLKPHGEYLPILFVKYIS